MPDDGASSSLPRGTAAEILRTTRDEARTVLNHQIDTLNDIDDKAMRTVRITLVVVSVLFSATTLHGAGQFVNVLTGAGTACLVASILVGLVTYSSSGPESGIGPTYLTDARAGSYSEREWLVVLLAGYAEWIEDMERLNQANARLLSLTQGCTGLGVLLLALGVALSLAQQGFASGP